jgi:hypothetical protein
MLLTQNIRAALAKNHRRLHTTRKATAATLLTIFAFTMTHNILTVQAGPNSFTATITPTEANINQLSTFTITITDTGDRTLGSASVAIPTGFTIQPPATIITPASWTLSLSETTINVTADGGATVLTTGESVVFTFTAITPASPNETVWTTTASSSIEGGGLKLNLEGEQPTVTVTSPTVVAPTISSSADTINQGQDSIITQTTSASGGTLPYTYQWLESLDGGAFSPIPGVTDLSHTFSTTTSTPIGTWRFQLTVTDNSNPQ